MIEAAGFAIIAHPDPADAINLLYRRAQDRRAANANSPPIRQKWRAARCCWRAIAAPARANLAALAEAAARDRQALPATRVALWGAGRLFDSLVLAGGFDPKCLTLLIDTHLSGAW